MRGCAVKRAGAGGCDAEPGGGGTSKVRHVNDIKPTPSPSSTNENADASTVSASSLKLNRLMDPSTLGASMEARACSHGDTCHVWADALVCERKEMEREGAERTTLVTSRPVPVIPMLTT